MPLKSGSDRHTISENIREFHHGPTYEHTKEKFGKAVADRQAVAAAMSNARKSGHKHHHHQQSKTRLGRM